MANSFLALLLILMIIRDGSMLVRHGRPFRLAFVVFWSLLACMHFTGRKELYSFIAISLITALIMKRREHAGLARLLEVDTDKEKTTFPGPGLYDREVDG